MVTAENSDSARMLWKYIMADPDAKAFLQGEEDPWGMRLNPKYSEAGVIADGLDYYPMTDLTPTEVVCGYATDGQTMQRTGQEISPYAQDMHEAAVKIRRGDIGTAYECSVDGQLTNWVKTG
ncbi:hypothetical protein NGM37_32345, partial [Streptomyces sp. TRM76130]|nr:hypothetical protein [Streptomyces sp. TRM76130]